MLVDILCYLRGKTFRGKRRGKNDRRGWVRGFEGEEGLDRVGY
jgi:hypothetical protein